MLAPVCATVARTGLVHTSVYITRTLSAFNEHAHQRTCSRNASKRRIYLDFNGHVTAATDWNRIAAKSGPEVPLLTPPFDIDGDNKTFNDEERRAIIAIWRAVSEDYAPFDVDVTTGGLTKACVLP